MKSDLSQKSSPAKLRERLLNRWRRGEFYRAMASGQNLFPLRIALTAPSAKDFAGRFDECRRWAGEFDALGSAGLLVFEYEQINNRVTGLNTIPRAALFADIAALARFLEVESELERFYTALDTLLSECPVLREWAAAHPFDLIESADMLDKLLRVAVWISAQRGGGIYLRQMSLRGIDTKFVERHTALLTQWLDLLVDPALIDLRFSGAKNFERRYGFLARPQLVRFRMPGHSAAVGAFSDLMVRADEFCAYNAPVETVFVCENDINALAFPDVKNAMIIFGRGYGFEYLAQAAWLKERRLYYWGDIDTHGFSILGQFRSLFPHTESMLMDRRTFLAHRELWCAESSPLRKLPQNLRDDESALFTDLADNTYGESLRLEQEVILFDFVLDFLERESFSMQGQGAGGSL